MTDERFVFQQDVKERQKMKTGAQHKKGAKRTTNCKFPSDYLSKKEKEKLSGECESINLSKPIYSIGELKSYPVSLQEQYLQNCINQYGARKTDILTMLKVSFTNFKRYTDETGVNLIFPKAITGRAAKMDDRWMDFITKPEDKVVKKTDEQIIEEHFGIKVEPVETITTLGGPPPESLKEAYEAYAEKSKAVPPKKVSGYSSVLKMQLNLKGSKAEIMHMMDAILGDECSYAVDLKIINANREENT